MDGRREYSPGGLERRSCTSRLDLCGQNFDADLYRPEKDVVEQGSVRGLGRSDKTEKPANVQIETAREPFETFTSRRGCRFCLKLLFKGVPKLTASSVVHHGTGTIGCLT